jgi:hypothetical protein
MKKSFIQNTVKVLLVLLLTVFSCFSCKESFLEVEPYGSLSESTLATEAGASKLLIGAYAALANGNYAYGIGQLRGADEQRIGSESGVDKYPSFLYSVDDGNAIWVYLFSGVTRANAVLRLLPKVEGASEASIKQMEAEARFLRGVFYHYLVMFFKNVPWIDETVTYSDRNYLVPNTVDVYPFIEADFKFAGDNLTDTKSEVGRANKWAAKAFLAKMYMFQHKYAEAKTLLTDIIANGKTSNGKKYALLEEYNLNFIQRGKHGSEAVFTIQMDVSDLARNGNGNPLDQYNGTYGGPATCCYGWGQPTFDLVDAFQTDPVTGLPLLDTYMNSPVKNDNGLTSSQAFTPYEGTLDSRLDWCVGRRGIPFRDWGNHPGKAWIRNQNNGGPYSYIKNIVEQVTAATDRGTSGASNNPYNIIRFADVLLWAAECEVEVGSLSKAEELVNVVRARAANPKGWVKKYIDPANPTKGFSDQPAANYKVGLYTGQFQANGKTYARKAVRFERRLELALEHHRFFDMVRYDGNDYDIAAVLNWFMQTEGKKLLNKSNNYLKGVFERNKHEYYPIPITQIDLSVDKDGKSVLVQNPGW